MCSTENQTVPEKPGNFLLSTPSSLMKFFSVLNLKEIALSLNKVFFYSIFYSFGGFEVILRG